MFKLCLEKSKEKRRRTNPYAQEVHHKPTYNMVKPTPMRSALSVRELALLSLSGDFLGNRANMSCTLCRMQGQRYTLYFYLPNKLEKKMQKERMESGL